MEYSIPDIESGQKVEVSKEQYEAYLNMWQLCKPRIEKVKGTILIFGTSGELDDNSSFEKIFFNPENYKLK